VFGGFYGAGSHRKQMYKCYPVGKDKPHRFVPVMPRLPAAEARSGGPLPGMREPYSRV
jgi:hypothetical protein